MTRWKASASFALLLALSISPASVLADPPTADDDRRACHPSYVKAITDKFEACDGMGEQAVRACEAEYEKANSSNPKLTEAQRKKKEADDSGKTEAIQKARQELNELVVAQSKQIKHMKEVCKRNFAICKENCADPDAELNACQEDGEIPEAMGEPLGRMRIVRNNCASQESRLMAGADALLANLEKLGTDIAKGKCDTAAGDKCEETPAPETAGPANAGNGTDTSGGNNTTDPKKNETQAKGNADMSGVMAAAASLMQAAMTPPTTTPPTPMQPAELPADHCARPENKNEMVCMCQGSGWSLPQCRQGQEVQAAQAMGGEITGGGGAKLVSPTAATGDSLKLPSMPMGMPAIAPPPPGGGGGGGGTFAGGGGGGGGLNTGSMRPSGPDKDDRPTGSALSADILSGGRGGGGFAGARPTSSAPRNPEGLPGYALGLPRAGTKPDLEKFEPSMTPPVPPPRIIAGQAGERRFDPNLGTLKLHPASTIIWKPITQRYRALDHTFEP